MTNVGEKQSPEKAKDTTPTVTTAPVVVSADVVSEFKLPEYTETELLMDDVVFYARDNCEGTRVVNLADLKFDEDDCTNGWTVRKGKYAPELILPAKFDELLSGNFGNLFFFSVLDPTNINKKLPLC